MLALSLLGLDLDLDLGFGWGLRKNVAVIFLIECLPCLGVWVDGMGLGGHGVHQVVEPGIVEAYS